MRELKRKLVQRRRKEAIKRLCQYQLIFCSEHGFYLTASTMIKTIRRIAYAYVWNFDISNRILFGITYKFAQRNLCILIIVLLSVNALRSRRYK